MPAQLLAGEHHRERLSRALGVPDEAGPILGGDRPTHLRHHAIHQLVHRLELVIAGNLLRGSVSPGLEDDEVLQEIEHVRRLQPQETLDGRLQRIGGVCGLGLVPPAVMVWIEAEPTAPPVEVAIDVLLARIVKQDRPVTELLLVRGHAEDVGGQHRGCLALVAVELMYRLAPVVAAGHVALVLGDDEGDAVDQQHHVVAALLDALHAVLIGRVAVKSFRC